jgi:hypothetical protein
MRFLLSTMLIAVFSLAITWWMPWWAMAIVAALVSFALRPRPAFFAGFLAIFVLWLAVGLVADAPNDHILATRMARVLPLGGQWWLFLIVSAFVGGLVGGFSSWTGAAIADTFRLKHGAVKRSVA